MAEGVTEAAYLTFSENRDKVAKTIDIREFVGPYQGPDVYLDFSAAGELVGIEFLLEDED